MNKAPITSDSSHVNFARQHYGVNCPDGTPLTVLFDKIVHRNGFPALTRLPSRTKRNLLHAASVYPQRGKPWFEKNCAKRFLSKSRRVMTAMERDALRSQEVSQLWEYYADIAIENRTVLGALPSRTFYNSKEWLKFRSMFLACMGEKCRCCGAKRKHGIRIDLDHIKPRYLYPELAFRPDNIQVLCEACHKGKGQSLSTNFTRYSRVGGA